jgi:membrane protease YdiL (CAAX protease family)
VRARLESHPLVSVLVLELAFILLVVGGSLALGALLPGLPGYSVRGPSQSLVLVLLAAATALVLVAAMRWWSLAGFTRASRWRQLQLYWLPVALLAVPFVGGVRPLPSSALGILVIAYLATGVFEETMWRGMVLGLLRPTGVWRAVLLSSLLFGLGHLGNSVLRGASVLVLAQAFGSAVQGVGLAALRLRTGTIWPLIALHALHDLFLQMSALPIPLVEVPIDTVFLVYGIVLLRGRARGGLAADEPTTSPGGQSEAGRSA